MATSYYSTGTVSLTNGSAVVTGVGTAWQTALVTSGWLLVRAAEGNVLPIRTVDGNTQITAEWEWEGADGTYEYCIQRDSDQVRDNAENSKNLVALLDQIRNGQAFKYDQSGLLADRALFDARPKGFAYLVVGGATADLYVKRSNTAGDWAGPYGYGAGPVGPAPTLGIGNVTTRPAGQPATASVSGSNGSYVINLGLPAGELTAADMATISAATQQAIDASMAADSSATEAEMYAEMVGAAVYDFNFDTDPATPGLDWND